MMLWIIAAIAGAVLLAGVAFLALGGKEPSEPATRATRHPRPSHAPQGPRPSVAPERVTRPPSVPPPGGVPIPPTRSEEMGAYALEEEEAFVDDDEPTGPVPAFRVSAAGRTDPGRKRSHNEDAFVLMPDHGVYAVADGMGGYAAGEVASELAVATLRECFEANAFDPVEPGFPRRGAELMGAIRRAHHRIRRDASRDRQKKGMGTTVVAARFAPRKRRVYVAHVGDSRCYRLRDGELTQLTTDHTLGAVGITGPSAGKLSRAVGVFDDVDVDLRVDEPRPGDVYLLCSDGLFKMVPAQMIEHLAAQPDLEQATQRLVREANDRGGRDNVSVVLVRVDAA
ncbi:MAG TPA: protein phosphatase 2C domain-containing protein [Sandaracinaceae bacterium LLY-WYZ-13_1]|nr:protein phosphatase 2C domain-containing protein [Sandaracinaceae bacterium LLY-WYZ-13_1]